MKLSKYLIALMAAGLLAFQSITYAGPTITNGSGYVEAVIVSDYDLGGDASTTKVYDEEEGTANNSGMVYVGDTNDSITYHVDLKTKGSATVICTFEGKLDDNFNVTTGQWMLLYTKTFSATDTQYSLSLSEGALKYVRVGMQATASAGTDDITITMRAEGTRK